MEDSVNAFKRRGLPIGPLQALRAFWTSRGPQVPMLASAPPW